MSKSCRLCHGSGLLLEGRSWACSLCEGDPFFCDDEFVADLPSKALPIFILAGQSNCVGRGAPSDLSADLAERVASHVRICFDLERHRPEEAHASGWISLTPSCQVNPQFGPHFGPEFTVADDLRIALSCSDILVMKFAMGSSSMVMPSRDGGNPEWDLEGEHVRAMIQFLREHCTSVGRPAYFAGMFWNQGNSDLKVKESDGSAAKYTDRLVELVTQVRSELRQFHRGLPFVACHVRKGSKAKTTQQINAAISKACDRLADATCIPIPEGANLLPDDDFHFDGTSLLSLGHAYSEAMRTFL